MNPTDLVKDLAHYGYDIFSLNTSKAPVDRNGQMMTDWESKTHAELMAEIRWAVPRFGIRLGTQTNGRKMMSLDFDCCGAKTHDPDPTAPKRAGCETTRAYLEEYKAVKGCDNGFYESSTEGNMNVLIDYTDSIIITEAFKRALIKQPTKKNKLGHNGMEIFFGKVNQAIPPTASISKWTEALGAPRRYLNDNPIMLFDGTQGAHEQWVADLIDKVVATYGVARAPRAQVITPQVSEAEEDAPPDTTDMYHELLYDIIDNKAGENGGKRVTRDEWLEICGALMHAKKPKRMWTDWSRKWSQTDTASRLWDNFKRNPRPVSIFTLEKIAKKYEYDKYRDWLVKHKKFLKLKVLTAGANDVAQFLAPIASTQVKYCNKIWYVFETGSNLWRMIDNPRAKIITLLQSKIDEAKMTLCHLIDREADEAKKKKLQEYEKEYIRERAHCSTGGYADNLKIYLTDYLFEKDCYKLFNKNTGEIAFKNGILDLRTLGFRHGIKQSDYLTKTIDSDYKLPTEEDTDNVRHELKKICNWNDRHLEYYLSVIGYALTGEAHRKQMFWFLRGQKASNGKSVIFEALEAIMGCYVGKTKSTTFDLNAPNIHKAVGTWDGLRLLWVNELSDKKQNAELLNAVCDGTNYKYDRLYGYEEEMKIQFKLFVVSNHTMEVGDSNGTARRHKLLQMNSDFSDKFEEDNFEKREFKADEKFSGKLAGEYKYALMALIFEYSKEFYADDDIKAYPTEWEVENKQAINDNNKFKEWFNETFETGAELMVSKARFEAELNCAGLKGTKYKDKLAGMRICYEYDSQLRQEGSKGWFRGFGIVEHPDDAEGEQGGN